MLKRRLGRTGLEVPIVGLGGAGLGQPLEEITPLINHALERGSNFIHVYASQEANVGRVLAGKRKEFIIAAHVDVYSDPQKKMGTADEIMGRVETCLRDLQTDCVELFQFHGVMDEESLTFIRTGGALAGLKKAQEQGKIQHIGITGHYSPPLVNALKTGDFDTVMVPFNIMRRDFGADPSIGLFPLAKRMDIGVIIMKPIANGRITQNLPTALKFVLAHDVTLAIPGAHNIQELDEDIDAAGRFTSLFEEERKQYADELFILGEPFHFLFTSKVSGMNLLALGTPIMFATLSSLLRNSPVGGTRDGDKESYFAYILPPSA
ncbi:MAG: aldo/keto reductase [Candidatus Poribacteria bacterium]